MLKPQPSLRQELGVNQHKEYFTLLFFRPVLFERLGYDSIDFELK